MFKNQRLRWKNEGIFRGNVEKSGRDLNGDGVFLYFVPRSVFYHIVRVRRQIFNADAGRFFNGVFNRVRCRQHEFVRQESFQIYFLVFFRPVDADVFGDFFIRTGIFWHLSERRPVYS